MRQGMVEETHTHLYAHTCDHGHTGGRGGLSRRRKENLVCRRDRAAAAGKTSYSGEQMDRVGEWMSEQGVLAPSLSRDSKDGLALLLQAGCFV